MDGPAERLDADRRAVRRLQRVRQRYGAPDHVRRVLDESPEPFAVASREKRAAMAHFQPQGVLVSQGLHQGVSTAGRAARVRCHELLRDLTKDHGLGG